MISNVVIANTAEAFEQLLVKVAHTGEGARKIRHEMTLAQRAFFYGADDKVVITPHPIPGALLTHNSALCGFTNVQNISPEEPAVALSKVAAEDDSLLESLVGMLRTDGIITFLPYAAVPAFQRFVDKVRKRGISVVAEENSASFPQWLFEYLDSKIGFRSELQQLATAHLQILIPEGFIARNAKEGLSIAEWFYARNRSAVLKVNLGESGWGLWILKTGDYPNAAAARKAFRVHAAPDPIWKNTPLVVEEFIEADERIAGGSPSTELVIGNDGPRITYCCSQLLDSGQFFGIEMGKGVLAKSVKNELEEIALIVGHRYHTLGYRGYCDIDFVVAKNNDVYSVETNPRRTGGTHVFDLAYRLFGGAWESDRYFLSHDSFQYGAPTREASDLLAVMQPLLFPIRGERRGFVVTSINPSEPVFGYVAIDADKASGMRLQRELHNLFGTVPRDR